MRPIASGSRASFGKRNASSPRRVDTGASVRTLLAGSRGIARCDLHRAPTEGRLGPSRTGPTRRRTSPSKPSLGSAPADRDGGEPSGSRTQRRRSPCDPRRPCAIRRASGIDRRVRFLFSASLGPRTPAQCAGVSSRRAAGGSPHVDDFGRLVPRAPRDRAHARRSQAARRSASRCSPPTTSPSPASSTRPAST